MSLRQIKWGAAGLLLLPIMLTACSESYRGEQLLWKAAQKGAVVLANPKGATNEQITKALDAYQKVITKAPGSISAVKAYMEIANIHLVREDFGAARESYEAILKNYHQYKQLSFQARIALARTYEAEKNWKKAIDAYVDLYDRYPWSSVGMQVPMYIVQLYDRMGDRQQFNKALESSIRLYTKQVPDAPNPMMANRVRSYLALLYQQNEEWDKAAKVLEDVISEQDPYNRPAAILSLATLYEQRIKDVEKARALYFRLFNEYPNSQFEKAARFAPGKLGENLPPEPDVEDGSEGNNAE